MISGARMKFRPLCMSIVCSFLIMCGLLSVKPELYAQTTTQGAITGTAIDPTGAILSNATVKIVNDATNIETVLQSNATGAFSAPLLDPGTYTVTHQQPWFPHLSCKAGHRTSRPDHNARREPAAWQHQHDGRSYCSGASHQLRIAGIFFQYQYCGTGQRPRQ